MSTATFPLPLDYAPQVPLLRRKRVRVLIVLVSLVTLSIWAWKRGPQTWRAAQYWYADYRCASHALPPGQVVYEEDPLRSAALLKRSGYALIPRPTSAVEGAVPRSAAAGYMPPAWDELLRQTGKGPIVRCQSEAVLFLHARKSPNGNRRIVAVHIDGSTTPSASLSNLINFRYPYVVVPAADGKPPTLVARFPMCGTGFVYPDPSITLAPMRFYAGQPDPNDESRFTIDYELPQGRGTIEGKLTDADFVSMQVLDGPAKDRYLLYTQT